MNSRAWKELRFEAPPNIQELLVGPLSRLGIERFLQEDDSLLGYVEARNWSPSKLQTIRRTVRNFEGECGLSKIQIRLRTLGEQNWNARWERNAGIVEASRRFVVKPSWKKLRRQDRGKLILHIDPKMSFGTGHHESTRLSLSLLESFVRNGDRVLDVGTGTGILAIAAVKLGASRAIGIDNDAWAITNARENVRRNRVEKRVKILPRVPASVRPSTFNVVVANIDLPTIKSMLPRLHSSLNANGVLLLSGILLSDVPSLLTLVEKRRLLPLEIVAENEWVAVALVNANAHQRS